LGTVQAQQSAMPCQPPKGLQPVQVEPARLQTVEDDSRSEDEDGIDWEEVLFAADFLGPDPATLEVHQKDLTGPLELTIGPNRAPRPTQSRPAALLSAYHRYGRFFRCIPGNYFLKN
jgi:hypothetical protein